MSKKIKADLLDEKQIQKTLIRLSHEIIEKNSDLDNLAIIGIRTHDRFLWNWVKILIAMPLPLHGLSDPARI